MSGATVVPQYICSQINAPSCVSLDLNTTTYLSRSGSLFGLKVDAPYTLALLIVSILQTIRMYYNTKKMHACIGKGEVKYILLLFITYCFFTIPVINFQNFIISTSEIFYTILAAIQIASFSTLFFAIFASGITIDRIHGIMRMTSHVFLSSMTFFFAAIVFMFSLLGLFIYNYYLFAIIIIMNTMSVFLYLITQVRKLKRIKSDIWAYGILGIMLFIYTMSLLPMFVGSELIAVFTEKNLDSFFVFQVFITLFVIMYHKYWLSTCDFEIECLEFKFQ